MTTIARVSTAEFEQALTPAVMRTIQMIYLALIMGVIVFTAAVFIIYSTDKSQENVNIDPDLLTTMSLVHACFALAAYALATFQYKSQFRTERLSGVSRGETSDRSVMYPSSTPAESYLSIIRTALIIRLALMQGAAFFGLVTCIIGATSGALRLHPEYWANLASSVVMIGFCILTFPNKERLAGIFEEKINRTYPT